jgi:hypothetical protein
MTAVKSQPCSDHCKTNKQANQDNAAIAELQAKIRKLKYENDRIFQSNEVLLQKINRLNDEVAYLSILFANVCSFLYPIGTLLLLNGVVFI